MLLPTMAFEVLLEGKQSEGQETLDVLRSPSTESTTNHHEWAEAGPGATGGPDELCSNATCVRRWGKVQAERFRGGFYWVLLSMLVPALIISVLREVCRTSQSASIGKAPGTWIRRLSSSEGSTEEDDTLSQLIEVCAEMQEDLALSVPQRTNPDGPMDAAEQVARIAFDLELEALAFERAMRRTQQQGRASIPSQPRHPASADISCQRTRQAEPVHMPGPQLGSPSNVHLQSGITVSESEPSSLLYTLLAAPTRPLAGASHRLPSVPPPVMRGPAPLDRPPQAALPSSQPERVGQQSFAGTQPPVVASNSAGLLHQAATLLPQDVAHINTRGQPLSQLPSVEHSGSDPDMWLEEGPATESALEAPKQSSHSSHWMSPDPAAHASWQVPEGESNTGAAGLRSPAESTGSARRDSARLQPEAVAEEAPATARALAAARASLQADLDAHPYVRLPGLARGVVVPNILLSRTSFVSTKGQPLRDALFPLRHLFSRLELSQTEVNFLVGHIEELAIASGGRAKQATLMGRPGHGIATLGQQFLVLDAIVSSLQVLGISPHSLSWWGSFVGCFDTSYRFAEPSSRSQERSRVVGDFANRLLDAISTFKRGGRPKSQDIIFLKRFLFFSPHAPARYANPSWDQWRYDHLQFEERHPAALVKAATREPLHLTRDVRANRDSTAPWLEGEQDPRWHTPGVRTFKLNTRGLFRPSCKEVTLPFLWRYEGFVVVYSYLATFVRHATLAALLLVDSTAASVIPTAVSGEATRPLFSARHTSKYRFIEEQHLAVHLSVCRSSHRWIRARIRSTRNSFHIQTG